MAAIDLYGFRARRERLQVIVSDSDLPLISRYRWYPRLCRNGSYYAVRHIITPEKHATQFMHNLIMGSLMIDHANGNGLDNRRENLRQATAGQNAKNAGKRRDARTSEFKGVSWRTRGGKWVAQIQVDGKKRHLGYFETELVAAQTYDVAAREFFGEFARLNFPEVS